MFKITLKPIIKDRQWEYNPVQKSKKEKKCSLCGKDIKIGMASATFTKRTTMGSNTNYQTLHTCVGNHAQFQAEILGCFTEEQIEKIKKHERF